MGVVLLLMGVAEYLVGIAENYHWYVLTLPLPLPLPLPPPPPLLSFGCSKVLAPPYSCVTLLLLLPPLLRTMILS